MKSRGLGDVYKRQTVFCIKVIKVCHRLTDFSAPRVDKKRIINSMRCDVLAALGKKVKIHNALLRVL